MLLRAFCLVASVFWCSASIAASCTYDTDSSFLSRVVAIGAVGGLGSQPAIDEAAATAPAPLELHAKEVVLTFDGGPHSAYTGYILDILDHHCAKAAFFFTGSAALANRDAARDAGARGHTLALGLAPEPAEGTQAGIEKGFASIAKAAGAPVAPFLRGGPASMPDATLGYLKERGVSLMHADIASGDTEPGLTASQLANKTLLRIREAGKGIVQFSDTRKVTVDALDSILTGLKLSGFKVVQIVAAENFTPKDEPAGGSAEPAFRAPVAGHTSRMFIEAAKRRVRVSEPEHAERRRTVLRREMLTRRQLREREAELAERRLLRERQAQLAERHRLAQRRVEDR